ncbi:MAG: radical SAM protein [Candidatus Gottesmanbacteria bacterium]
MNKTYHLFFQLPRYWVFREFGKPKILPVNYTFLISTECNSRCLTCNIWKQKHKELTLEEWEKIFTSLGKSPFWVTISGGEPFLKSYLADLVINLDNMCQPAIINIPTNSLLPGIIEKQLINILLRVKKTPIVVNLSLDGVGKIHDQIRGIPGNFEKVVENYQNVKKLQTKYPNLMVGFNSVISKYNINTCPELFKFVYKLHPDSYITEIAEQRVELGTINMDITPNYKQYTHAINNLVSVFKRYKFKKIGLIAGAFRQEYYHFVKDWLSGKKVLNDYAGYSSCEISSWGEVWPSCIKAENMGNLRSNRFNFKKIWFSQKADKIRKRIKKTGTSYPLANAFYTNALFNAGTIVKTIGRIIIASI